MPKHSSEPTETPPGAQAMLLDFLREYEASCPVCGYNLKGLTRPVCPECRHDLVLTVGVPRLGLRWLLVALVPGFFSGVAACFVAIPTVGITIEEGALFLPFVGAVLFGWCSGLFAILLAMKRHRFLGLSVARQRCAALAIWATHVLALGVLIWALNPYVS